MTLLADVRAAVTDIVGPTALEGIEDDTPLFEHMVLDSLGLVAIVTDLEERFHIIVTPEDLVPDNFGSLGQMAHFVAVKRRHSG
jgi:acyl carrier protein